MTAGAIKLSKAENTMTSIVHGDTSFIALLICMASFAYASRAECHVRFLDVRFNDIVDGMISSNSSSSDSSK